MNYPGTETGQDPDYVVFLSTFRYPLFQTKPSCHKSFHLNIRKTSPPHGERVTEVTKRLFINYWLRGFYFFTHIYVYTYVYIQIICKMTIFTIQRSLNIYYGIFYEK